MSNDKIATRSVKRRLIPTVAIIIIIVIILSSIYIWNNNEESNPLEFRIELVESPYDITNESPYDITNKSIYYQIYK